MNFHNIHHIRIAKEILLIKLIQMDEKSFLLMAS